MARIDSLETLLTEELRDILDAERGLTKVMPQAIEAARNDELQSALRSHLAETTEHVARLERALELLGAPVRAKACAGMRGIIEEMQDHLGENYDDDGLRDAQIIGSAQRAEHYEIAAYGTAAAHAALLGLDEVEDLLNTSLDEEKAANETLTRIAEMVVNLEAAAGDEDDDDAGGDPAASPTQHGKSR
jgi:ferritin-like metal-binding protein YciE